VASEEEIASSAVANTAAYGAQTAPNGFHARRGIRPLRPYAPAGWRQRSIATEDVLRWPSNGERPGSSAKRAIKARKNALAQHSWKASDQPAWLTPEFYEQKIQPLLANVSMSAIRSSIGVSKWYASKIQQGYRPHPRHWQKLAEIAEAK